MAVVPILCSGGTVGQGASATFFGPLCGSGRLLNNSTEGRNKIRWRSPGTLSLLTIDILTNDRGASTFRTRKNAANGSMSVSITASTTGTFQDATNTDTVSAGDDFAVQLVTGSGGTTFTYHAWACLFAATTNTVMRFGNHAATLLSGTDQVLEFAGGIGVILSGAESFTKHYFARPGTLKNASVNIFGNGRDATTTIKSRKNEADGNIAISITAATTGTFEDTSNSDTFAAGDFGGCKYYTAGTTGNVNTDMAAVDYETTDGSSMLFTLGNAAVNSGLTRYASLAGELAWVTTESDAQFALLAAKTLSRLHVSVRSNSLNSGSTTYKLRSGGSDAGPSVSVAASTTGRFVDSSGTAAITASDLLDYQMVTGGSSGSITTTQVGIAWGDADALGAAGLDSHRVLRGVLRGVARGCR